MTTAYKYSAYFFNTETDGVWVNFSETPKKVSSGFRTYYFYQTERPTGYSYVRIYVYSSNQSQGQEDSFYRVSEKMTLTTNYDTVAFGSSKGNKPGMGTAEAFSWTNYSSSYQGDGFGGNDGNKDKGTYSTKGIKAGNSIEISGGALTVCSYDDALHAGTDKAMESGAIPVGDVTVSGGTLTLSSNDDAIHADGKATVLDGSIRVLKSYEGIEGQTVEIAGGDVSVISSDDGLNGTATSGTSITVSGGKLYVLAGGDGVDANSQTAYGGILFSGGYSVIISTGKADSSIDSERGYKYSGGYVLGIGLSGGMGSESANCQNLSSYGKTTTLSLSQGSYLTVSGMASVKIPTSMSALVVVLGSASASVSSASSGFGTADINGVCWLVKEK